jgi:hypothetical protein
MPGILIQEDKYVACASSAHKSKEKLDLVDRRFDLGARSADLQIVPINIYTYCWYILAYAA